MQMEKKAKSQLGVNGTNKPLQPEDPVQLASQQILPADVSSEVQEEFIRGFENMYHKINL